MAGSRKQPTQQPGQSPVEGCVDYNQPSLKSPNRSQIQMRLGQRHARPMATHDVDTNRAAKQLAKAFLHSQPDQISTRGVIFPSVLISQG